MQIWDLDATYTNQREVTQYMAKHGYDKGKHPNYAIGEVVFFNTGYNDDIPAKGRIKGIEGEDLYIYHDCYWFPVKSSRITGKDNNQ